MTIVGFNFSKIDCEKKKAASKGSIDIRHDISIKNVEKTSITMGASKNEVLSVTFSFDVIYTNLGKVGLTGEIVYSDTKEIISEVFKSWEKDKKLAAVVEAQIYKFIYTKTIVKVLELANDLGLPSPIPLPKINFGAKPKK